VVARVGQTQTVAIFPPWLFASRKKALAEKRGRLYRLAVLSKSQITVVVLSFIVAICALLLCGCGSTGSFSHTNHTTWTNFPSLHP